MSIRNYSDFIINTDYFEGLSADRKGRPAKFSLGVYDSPVGEGEHSEAVDIPDWDQLEMWRKMLAERSISPGDLELFAGRLGSLILPPYARQMYSSSLSRLQEREGLRIRLRLLPELALLPWEYALIKLHDGGITSEDYWALDYRLSIVRHEAIAVRAAPFRSSPNRRVIVAMASPPPYEKYPKLELGAEQRAIKSELSAVRGVHVEYHPDYDGEGHSEGATEDIIRKALRDSADIFHFSGHGIFRPEEGRGAIILAGPDKMAKEIDSDALEGLLAEGQIRLVILDACESGERDMFHRWSSVATALLKGGIPAVVAMQFSIYDDLTKEFAKKLYEYLVAGLTIDEAVMQGRKAMHARDAEARDWGAPVLYLRNAGGIIFPAVTDEQARIEAEMASERDTTMSEVSLGWARRSALANPEQLELLKEGGASLRLAPLDSVLLLRSAVDADQDTSHWVAQLRAVGTKWLEQMQVKPAAAASEELGLAEKHLGLDGSTLTQPPQGVGMLTWSAVTHPDPLTAETAALALLALEPQGAVGKIQGALRNISSSASRRRRRAALLGSLAESDPAIDKDLKHELDNIQDRVAVWWWRAMKHIRRNRATISRLTFGGALGAAAALAIYRAFLAVFNSLPMGTEFAINSYWGFVVGLGVAFGLVIAAPLLLQDIGATKAETTRNLVILSMLLAAIGFSLANGVVVWMNGLELTLSTFVRFLVTAFLVGVGLSFGLSRQPAAGWRLGSGAWFLRLGAVALFLAIIQLPVLCETATKPDGTYWLDNAQWLAASIIAPRQQLIDIYRFYPFMDALFSQGMPTDVGGCCFASPTMSAGSPTLGLLGSCFAPLLSVLDAALVGIVLTVGITAGLHFSQTRFGRVWANLMTRLQRGT